MSPKRPQMNQIRDFSKTYSSVRRPFEMGSWGSAVKTSASYNWRNSRPNFNYNSGPTFIRTVNANGPHGRPKPAKAWVTRINWRILKNSMGDLLPLEVAKATFLNQANPHAAASEVTNNACTPTSSTSEEKDEEVERIVVPSAVRIPEEKDKSRTSSTNSKKEDSSTDFLEDNLRFKPLEESGMKYPKALWTVP
ncbi:hypothetical protein Tco_1493899 [Tanacetum coccineum]